MINIELDNVRVDIVQELIKFLEGEGNLSREEWNIGPDPDEYGQFHFAKLTQAVLNPTNQRFNLKIEIPFSVENLSKFPFEVPRRVLVGIFDVLNIFPEESHVDEIQGEDE